MKLERHGIHSISVLLKFKLFQSAKTQFSPLHAHPYKIHIHSSLPKAAETLRHRTRNSSARRITYCRRLKTWQLQFRSQIESSRA